MMDIFIPTYRRPNAQLTFQGLPKKNPDYRIFHVVDEKDASDLAVLRNDFNLVVHPPEVKTIAQKRAWIFRHWHDLRHTTGVQKIMMFDDDLRFAVRGGPDSTKLFPADEVAVLTHLRLMDAKLDFCRHGGFSPRQGNNNMDPGWTYNTRSMYAIAFHVPTVMENCELGRIEHREDMDYTLQLLRKGFKNAVTADICTDQKYNAAGGASLERTMEASNADALKLAELHPGLVKPVEKAYKGSINRTEVIVSWKKAYDPSLAR